MDNLFWDSVKAMYGVDGFIEEKAFFKKVAQTRLSCKETNDPYVAIENAYYFDKQYFLQQWWEELQIYEKQELLFHVWKYKGDGVVFGYDWWLPYFNEVGFLSNEQDKPMTDIILYRAAEKEFSKGMSWTDDYKMAETFLNVKTDMFGERFIYKATVKPINVLGIINGKVTGYVENEKVEYEGMEYIVNHNDLKNIEVI